MDVRHRAYHDALTGLANRSGLQHRGDQTLGSAPVGLPMLLLYVDVDNFERVNDAAGLGEGLRAGDWKDIFIAWAPSKNVSLTAAYVDLGTIVPATTNQRKQRGVYVSAQFAF